MAGQREAVENLRPCCNPAFPDETRQSQQLPGIGLRFGRTYGSPRTWADRDQIVIASRHCTFFKVEAKTQLREQQQLKSYEGSAPPTR